MPGGRTPGSEGADRVHQRHQHEVREKRSGADDGRVADADDIADADDGGVVEDAQGHELALEDLPEADRPERQLFGPGVKGRGEPVVEGAEAGREGEDLGLAADLLAGHQDLGGGRSFGPRQLAVELDHEVVAQRDEEQDAETAAEEGNDDDLEHGRLGDPRARFGRQHVERRDGEDGARHDVRRVGADRLHDDVFEDRAAPGEKRRQPDREDGDRDRRLDALADPEREIGGGHRKERAEKQAHRHRPRRHLVDAGLVRHHRNIGLARLQRTPRVLRQAFDRGRLAVLHGLTSLGFFGRHSVHGPPSRVRVRIRPVKGFSGDETRSDNCPCGPPLRLPPARDRGWGRIRCRAAPRARRRRLKGTEVQMTGADARGARISTDWYLTQSTTQPLAVRQT